MGTQAETEAVKELFINLVASSDVQARARVEVKQVTSDIGRPRPMVWSGPLPYELPLTGCEHKMLLMLSVARSEPKNDMEMALAMVYSHVGRPQSTNRLTASFMKPCNDPAEIAHLGRKFLLGVFILSSRSWVSLRLISGFLRHALLQFLKRL